MTIVVGWSGRNKGPGKRVASAAGPVHRPPAGEQFRGLTALSQRRRHRRPGHAPARAADWLGLVRDARGKYRAHSPGGSHPRAERSLRTALCGYPETPLLPSAKLRGVNYRETEAGARDVLLLPGKATLTPVVPDFHKTDSYGSTASGHFIRLWKPVHDRNGRRAFGGADGSAQRTSACLRLSIRPERVGDALKLTRPSPSG